MSHNKLTVDNQTPNSLGEIPVNLSSYINESSPGLNQIIKYNGSEWINSSMPGDTGFASRASVILRNSAVFSGSGSFSVGDYLMIQQSASRVYYIQDTGFNFNAATSTNTIKNNSNWLESIDIPSAGTYLVMCTFAVKGGQMSVRLESNSGGFSNYVDVSASSNTQGSILIGILEASGSDNVRVVVQSGSCNLYDDENHMGLSIHIVELS